MADYGVTEKGFKRKPYTQIIAEKMERAKDFFGEDVDLSDRSPLSLYIQADSWEESKLWEELENAYFSANIDDAEGFSLDAEVKILGLHRKPAQKAVCIIDFTGRPEKEIEAGTEVMTDTGVVFATLAAVTLDENGVGSVKAEALIAGSAGNVSAGRIDRLFTAVEGIESVYNAQPSSGGSAAENDEELRERYYRSLSRRGKATCAAVEAALLEIASVKDAFVPENDTMDTVDGIPPKSIAPYVFDGDEASIVKAVLETKAGGIRSFGEITVDVRDNRGKVQKIGYTRAKNKDIYVKIELTRNTLFKPETENSIITSVIRYIGGFDMDGTEYNGLGLGQSVMHSKLVAVCDGAGIDDVSVMLSENGVDYYKNNIIVPFMQIAVTDFNKVEII